jgi:ABC-type phosphate/phosphonate transport system permease subunit
MDRSAARLVIFITLLFTAAVFFAAFYPADVFAGDHGETGELQHKVDLENQTGINLIIARLYNDNRLLFALAVTATMAVMGVIIGQITGFILRILGLK